MLIENYGSNGAYYIYNMRPLVSTFEGVASASDWAIIKSQTGCFFLPSYSSLGAKDAIGLGVADGLFSWAGWPLGNSNMNTYVSGSKRRIRVLINYYSSIPPTKWPWGKCLT